MHFSLFSHTVKLFQEFLDLILSWFSVINQEAHWSGGGLPFYSDTIGTFYNQSRLGWRIYMVNIYCRQNISDVTFIGLFVFVPFVFLMSLLIVVKLKISLVFESSRSESILSTYLCLRMITTPPLLLRKWWCSGFELGWIVLIYVYIYILGRDESFCWET